MNEPISIALADDNYIYRVGFKRELKKIEANIKLLFEAENGEELIEKLKSQRPDVVLTDMLMPVIDGVDATRVIKRDYPSLIVVGLSEINDNPYMNDFIEAGGNSYLSKESLHVDFVKALEDLILTGYHFNNVFTKEKVEGILQKNGRKLILRDGKRFSEKEVLVMRLISQHKTINRMAEELNMSVESIKKYKASLHNKLQVKKDSEIMAYAIKMGYIDMD
ncbi:MAG: response regulator transcription factor [Sphingobacteriales bacterium JAD_PAG50586_3]|nr:MAG: response regulator transcription factor [Sphingobacteriales bacterium JAD_PAG50586_3]